MHSFVSSKDFIFKVITAFEQVNELKGNGKINEVTRYIGDRVRLLRRQFLT